MDVTLQFDHLSEPQPLAIGAILNPISWDTDDITLSDEMTAWAGETHLATVSSTSSMVLAQQFDQDILGDLGNAWNHFVESGQVWALIICIILGYMIRNLTAY